MEMTLLLNATYEPIKVVDWQRAMVLWCQNKVEILATHDREARAVTFAFKLPSVVRLLRYAHVRRQKDFVPFTRANIYARDGYTCQYCRQPFKAQELTFDHVIPSAQGGTKGWENIVSACIDCNVRKGPRTPQEAGMTLAKIPRKPTPTLMLRVSIGVKTAPVSWREYLYWNVELDAE